MSPPAMKISSSSGLLLMELRQGIDGVRRAAALDLELATPRSRSSPAHRQPAQLQPVLGARVVRRRLVRRRRRPASAAPRSSPSWACASWAHTRWPRWGGLNIPPRMPSLRDRYGRTWPAPSTTYLYVHSSRTPIGPRACSFCVELPISAPMPNSPPSVKRVEAFTYTQAASTPRSKAAAALVGARDDRLGVPAAVAR